MWQRLSGRQWQRAAVGDIWQCAPSSPQHTARCFGALIHQPSPERKHQGDCGSAMVPIPCSEARECPGAGHTAGSRSVTEHGSGGTVMAAGSSTALPVLGSAGLGRGHQRTASTQQPLAHKLPGCPIPSVSNSYHSDRPDIVLAVMG